MTGSAMASSRHWPPGVSCAARRPVAIGGLGGGRIRAGTRAPLCRVAVIRFGIGAAPARAPVESVRVEPAASRRSVSSSRRGRARPPRRAPPGAGRAQLARYDWIAASRPDVPAGPLRQQPLVLQDVAVGLDRRRAPARSTPEAARRSARRPPAASGRRPRAPAIGRCSNHSSHARYSRRSFSSSCAWPFSASMPGQSLQLADVEPPRRHGHAQSDAALLRRAASSISSTVNPRSLSRRTRARIAWRSSGRSERLVGRAPPRARGTGAGRPRPPRSAASRSSGRPCMQREVGEAEGRRSRRGPRGRTRAGRPRGAGGSRSSRRRRDRPASGRRPGGTACWRASSRPRRRRSGGGRRAATPCASRSRSRYAPGRRQPHHQAAVLQRMGEVLRDEDRRARAPAIRRGRRRSTAGRPERFEVAQDRRTRGGRARAAAPSARR